VADAFVRYEFKILSAEGVALARAEVHERHFVGAADLAIYVMNLAGEPVGRKPFGHGVAIEKRPIYFFWRRTEDAVKADSVS
jgi:hypothetical protein